MEGVTRPPAKISSGLRFEPSTAGHVACQIYAFPFDVPNRASSSQDRLRSACHRHRRIFNPDVGPSAPAASACRGIHRNRAMSQSGPLRALGSSRNLQSGQNGNEQGQNQALPAIPVLFSARCGVRASLKPLWPRQNRHPAQNRFTRVNKRLKSGRMRAFLPVRHRKKKGRRSALNLCLQQNAGTVRKN